MENTELSLKELIIERYGSLKKFCGIINMPWTTLDSILKRGVANSNISNIMKITDELSIDTESLAYGIIKPKTVIYNNSESEMLQISGIEKEIILAYRQTDLIGKELVHRALDISVEEKRDTQTTTA